MGGYLVVLTGASGAGKTAIARSVKERALPDCQVLSFDSVGVPSFEEMREKHGIGHQPGGAWQRYETLRWMERIQPIVDTGMSVLFEGQMRIAFIREGLIASGIDRAHLILVDCDDDVRMKRLTTDRAQPNLASAEMLNWACYLRNEALENGVPILDTSRVPIADLAKLIVAHLRSSALNR
jgi:predicted kinase